VPVTEELAPMLVVNAATLQFFGVQMGNGVPNSEANWDL